jgi:hypothetical protein
LGEKAHPGGSGNHLTEFGLESIKDPEGNVIREAPLPVWANFQQRALDVAIAEVNAKTDL